MAHEEPVIRRPVKPGDDRGPGPIVYAGAGAAAVALIVVLLIAFIGGGDEVADPGWLDDDAGGNVVYCSGEDVSRSQRRSVKDFNTSPARGTAHAEFVELAPKADRQRAEYLQRMASSDCDLVYLDVIYTPEFASRDLLYDMTQYLRRDDLASSFDPRMISTATYADKLWGVPKQIDGGLLYYRRDKVRPPRTWTALAAEAEPGPGERPRLRLQLDAFEGLTVIFLELAYAAGAEPIVSDDGKTANIDQEGTLKALQLLQATLARGAVPRSVIDQGDKGSLWAFGVGRASFLRGWPYVEARLRDDAEVAVTEGNPTAPARGNTARNVRVVSLPPWNRDGRRVGILGGHNLVIPRTAKNPEGALHLIRFLTSEQQILRDAREASLAPVLRDLWDREEVRRSDALMAFRDEKLQARPPITSYWRVSQAIYTALRRVLSSGQGKETLPGELRDLQADVQSELDQQ